MNCLKMNNFLDCPLTFSGVELKNFCLNSATEEHWQNSMFLVSSFTMSFYGFRVRMLLSSIDNRLRRILKGPRPLINKLINYE